MERRWSFQTTKLRTPAEYSYPKQVEGPAKYLISAGPSTIGSHAITNLLKCPRRFVLSGSAAVVRAALETGLLPRKQVTAPTTDVVADRQMSGPQAGRSVYMTRGTLVHIAASHAAARLGALQHVGTVVLGHHIAGQEAVDGLYTPEEAIEVAAEAIGTASFATALPVSRRVGPSVARWLESTLAEGWRVLAIETQIAYWTPGVEIPHTARVDLLLQHEASGLVRIWDYKTANNPKSAVEEYRLGLQTRGLERIGRTRFGTRFDGVWLLTAKDPGAEGTVVLEEHRVAPVPHMDARFDHLLRLSRQVIEAYMARPAHEWPVVPIHCHGCEAMGPCMDLG